MSCNGCRVMRRGCSDQCALRPCLDGIDTPKAQANATIFVSKFFGRSDLLSFVSGVPDSKKSALFQSLLYEACGRTVNPVGGAVGLLSAGNWQVCHEAVETVLAGGELRPMFSGGGDGFSISGSNGEASESFGGAWRGKYSKEFFMHGSDGDDDAEMITQTDRKVSPAEASELTASFGSGGSYDGNKEPKLLNLFV